MCLSFTKWDNFDTVRKQLKCKMNFIITEVQNQGVPPKFLEGPTLTYFREKFGFQKKGCKLWAFDGNKFLVIYYIEIRGVHRKVD
jgi:hypothetical protein